VTLLVDTSVWSLGLRRDAPSTAPQVAALRRALMGDAAVATTGLILQELLQGFNGPKARLQIVTHFSALANIEPDQEDYVAAAEIGNRCRRNGIQLGTVDALLAQLCIRHNMVILTTDNDFVYAAKHLRLRVWPAKERS
jgi:predicted nucleic acid-binding protein